MKLLVLATLLVATAADVSHLGYRYGVPESSYDVAQNSVTGSAKYFEVSPTSPSPLLHVPIHEAQDFHARITNIGSTGYSTPSSILSRYSFSTPAPSLDLQQSFVSTTPAPAPSIESFVSSTPAPSVDVSSFSTPASILGGSFSTITPAPISLADFQNRYNFGLSGFSTPSPVVSFGSGQFGSIDSSLFAKDAALNSVHVSSSAGTLDDAFGISTPSSVSAEVYQDQPPEPQVNRHLYFFAAPEEPEQIRTRVRIASQPQKNIRVIFVKAPSPPAIAPVQITAPQQNEEKTIVYVLVKKPEDHQDINVNQAPTPAPPKPEVFFIKYKNQKEAEEAIQNIQAGQSHLQSQISVGDVDGGSSFVGSLSKQVYANPEPIVKYVKSSPVQTSFSSLPVFNSRIASVQYSTPAPIQYSTPASFQYTTSAPLFDSGLSFTTAAPSFDSGFNGLALTAKSPVPVVDNSAVNQNIVETSIESSTAVPQTVEIDGKLSESVVSSTVAPVISSSNYSPGIVVPQSRYQVYGVPAKRSSRSFPLYKNPRKSLR